MILICGIPSEPPVRAVAAAAARAGLPFALLNQRMAHEYRIELRVAGGRAGGSIRIDGLTYALERFRGVFTRLMPWEHLPENKDRRGRPADPARVRRSRRLHETLSAWMEIADCRVVNRRRAASVNRSKPFQSQAIRDAGFRIPDTLVTNDPEEVRRFRLRHGDLVFKSIGPVRSIVRRLGPAAATRLESVRHLPTQFQEYIRGTDIRVHVAGRLLFATEVQSRADDYRYAGREGEIVEMTATLLPSDIAERCRRLARRMDLPLCGIDLRRTPEGEYVCFEVNPMPAFSYYEEQTGQPLADAVAALLANGSIADSSGS